MNEHIKELVSRFIAHDESAFIELYRVYYKTVYDYAKQICKNHADAKDMTQETFLTIHKHIHTLKEIDAFPYWVRRIVISRCHRLFRKNKVAFVDPDRLSYLENIEDGYQSLFEKRMQNKFEKEELYKILQSLKKEYREILEYVYLKQMKYEEVAKLLGIPEGTAKTRARRAKAILAERIKEYEQENQRKLAFHQNGIFGGTLIVSCIAMIKNKCKKINPKHLQIASISSMVIFGSLAGFEVIKENKNHFSATIDYETRIEDVFQPVIYRGEWIRDSKTAYYKCLKYLYTKEKSETDYQQIVPIFSELKRIHNDYYQSLMLYGWKE